MNDYCQKFLNWHSNAAVRRQPRRMFDLGDGTNALFFSPELVPIVQHPIVQNVYPEAVNETLLQHLYTYLRFTKHLEQKVINKVTQDISEGNLPIRIPDDMMSYADLIYTDEAYHAQFSNDLSRQIQKATEVPPAFVGTPRFMRRLADLTEPLPGDVKLLADVCFATVSETLISGTLTKVPQDCRVFDSIRAVMSDHAHDEGLHHAYFSSLFDLLWPQFPRCAKEILGPLLPEFIRAFLDPDFEAIRLVLEQFHLSPDAIQQVLTESYNPSIMSSGIRAAAQVTIKLFERNGIMEVERNGEAFRTFGLLD